MRLCLAMLVSIFVAFCSGAQAQAQSPVPVLDTILNKLADDPQTPNAYTAAVKLHVHLRVFPWISITLNGNQAYKRPGLYHFVFRGVPRAAEHFSDMAYDLGNAQTWPARYEISLLTPPGAGIDPVIRLVPKKHALVKTLDITVDFEKGHIAKAVWSRYDGGVISLVNHYNTVGAHELVAQQNASINIPHMRAELDADYSGFQIGQP